MSNESIISENLQSKVRTIFAECGGSSCCHQTVPIRIWESSFFPN